VARVVHLTTTHDAFDTRVFQKECRSLAAAGHDVSLVAPAERDAVVDGVRLVAVPRPASRARRSLVTAWQVFSAARRLGPQVVHVHDPELLPYALLFRFHGTRAIYDAHENLPRDVASKHYLPRPVRAVLAVAVDLLERAACALLDGVVTVTPGIAARFPRSRTAVVRNVPLLAEFPVPSPAPHRERKPVVLYLGGLNRIRGVREMVRAISRVDASLGAELWLAGRFDPPALEAEVAREPGWARTRHLGWRSREQVLALLAESRVGLLALQPAPNHLDSLPIKMFEYMAAGLPVVASRFPAWEPLLANAGLLVDPTDPGAIAAALERLLRYPDEAQAMGAAGRAAIEAGLHWEREAATLLALYQRVAGR
jgi:glycosyltransferase involved in cell wall biosynthesis